MFAVRWPTFPFNHQPLLPVEHNGPSLEYKLSYRLLGVEDSWKEQMVKRHSFVVRDTPTFVPYEVKIQAFNRHGWAPEPKMVTGYSGEDCKWNECVDSRVTLLRLANDKHLRLEDYLGECFNPLFTVISAELFQSAFRDQTQSLPSTYVIIFCFIQFHIFFHALVSSRHLALSRGWCNRLGCFCQCYSSNNVDTRKRGLFSCRLFLTAVV